MRQMRYATLSIIVSRLSGIGNHTNGSWLTPSLITYACVDCESCFRTIWQHSTRKGYELRRQRPAQFSVELCALWWTNGARNVIFGKSSAKCQLFWNVNWSRKTLTRNQLFERRTDSRMKPAISITEWSVWSYGCIPTYNKRTHFHQCGSHCLCRAKWYQFIDHEGIDGLYGRWVWRDSNPCDSCVLTTTLYCIPVGERRRIGGLNTRALF